MRDVLARSHREILQQFAWSRVLLAFDYDGTLAPIVADPARADMRPRTRELLKKAAALYPCVVISGRELPDARQWLRGIPLEQVVGNHGIEPHRTTRAMSETTSKWSLRLARKLAQFKGVRVENKSYSIAVHYRLSREKRRALAAILSAARELEGVRIVGGKKVVNLIPEGAPHKGIALEAERSRLKCDTALYIGDDETDEDVFALDQPGRLLTIRVGAKIGSQASYFLRNQLAVDDLLEALVDFRGHPAALSSRA